MNYDFIQTYCLSKKAAEEDYKQEWDAIRYRIRDKMFALIHGNGDGLQVISVKHKPEHGRELRAKYKDVVPAYHFNKMHWSSVLLNGDTPETVLKQMLDESYELVFNKLSKKVQQEINCSESPNT